MQQMLTMFVLCEGGLGVEKGGCGWDEKTSDGVDDEKRMEAEESRP